MLAGDLESHAVASMGPRLGGRGDERAGDDGPADVDGASMGPRLGGRGDYVDRTLSSAANTLQWGRGSVAAETGSEDFDRVVLVRLQWGRGSVAAETSHVMRYRATLRPRLQWGRGSVAAETRQGVLPAARDHEASMGPRLGGRGDDRRGPDRPGQCQCFNGAAARWPRRPAEDEVVHVAGIGASMGPRLGGRGDVATRH